MYQGNGHSLHPLVSEGDYEVFDLVLTREKLRWMWDKINGHKALALEYGSMGEEGFVNLLLRPDSLFFEIAKEGVPVGIVYSVEIGDPRSVETHVIFFDSKLSDKVRICQKLLRYAFETYRFNRISTTIPDVFGATARFVQKVGFKLEGRKIKAANIKGNQRDVLFFGMLPEYLKNAEVGNGR